MKVMNCLAVLLIVVLMVGCSTTSSNFASMSGFGFGGKRVIEQADPSRPVDPGQTGLAGINGQSGPYAAAVTLGTISNPEARKDSLEAIKTISENESIGIWGRGARVRGGQGLIGQNNRAPAIEGVNVGFGRMENPFPYPIKVYIRGLGSPHLFRPGEVLELHVPHGRYELVIYNAETGQLIGAEKLDTSYRSKLGDKSYDFNIWLDGNDLH